MLRCSLGLGLSLLVCVGCGGDGTNGDDADGAVDAGATDAFVPPEDSYSLTWGPVTVAPGVERTQCVTLRLGNVPKLHVGKIHNELTGGSHHLIVYRTTASAEIPTPEDCIPFSGTVSPNETSPLMITQRHDELLELPAGVAFSFAPDQMIRLEMHYINAGEAPMEIKAVSTFIPMSDAEFHDEADFLFIGNPDIHLAPGAEATVGPAYFAMPAQLADAKIFALTGHTHQYGLNVHIATANGPADTGTPRYEHPDWVWNEPDTTYFSSPFTVPTNGGFRFSCDYRNTSSAEVGFGESVNEEMCFFWAYYYPSNGAHVCLHSEELGANDCCPDNPLLCYAIQQYLGQ